MRNNCVYYVVVVRISPCLMRVQVHLHRDVVLLDGSFLHGVSRLQDLGGTKHMESRPQLSRFSMIVFNRWKRAKRISRAWSGESWRDAVPWK